MHNKIKVVNMFNLIVQRLMELTNITREIIHELGNHPSAKTKWVDMSYLVFKCFIVVVKP